MLSQRNKKPCPCVEDETRKPTFTTFFTVLIIFLDRNRKKNTLGVSGIDVTYIIGDVNGFRPQAVLTLSVSKAPQPKKS